MGPFSQSAFPPILDILGSPKRQVLGCIKVQMAENLQDLIIYIVSSV